MLDTWQSIALWASHWQGELAALSAAFLWAVSSTVYALLGKRLSPLLLNFLKGAIALVFICLTLFLGGQVLPTFDPFPTSLLLLSGALGIGLGDTAYFVSLNHLGARRSLLLETLTPPLVALLAFVFLKENLSAVTWGSIFLTLLGVVWVIAERTPASVATTRRPLVGITWGILAALTQAVGVVLSRYALVSSLLTPLWSTLLRLLAGTAIAGVLLLLSRVRNREKGQEFSPLWTGQLVIVIILAAFGSTYLGIWLQQAALKFAPAGIAQTLLATSPLFVLPIARAMGEKISLRAVLGVLVALAGVGLLFSNPF